MNYVGFEISLNDDMNYIYGRDVFGPVAEKRYLDDIRQSLQNPNCEGPNLLYSIAMNTGKNKDRNEIESRDLLFGIVSYSRGSIDNTPIRSQGHIHGISKSCNQSTPEVYQIFKGEAIIYMQENSNGNAGDCYAVKAKEGEIVIVPPKWVHATINSSEDSGMTFGAWCVKDFVFDYKNVRKNNGIAFYPYFDNGNIKWEFNKHYINGDLHEVNAREYTELNVESYKSIYNQFEEKPDLFMFVSKPDLVSEIWRKEIICNF